jgi:hypothetical protein
MFTNRIASFEAVPTSRAESAGYCWMPLGFGAGCNPVATAYLWLYQKAYEDAQAAARPSWLDRVLTAGRN